MMEQFLNATGAKVLKEGLKTECQGISTDTRTIKTGELFFALTGPNFDGHSFCEAALKKGAWGAVVENPKSKIRNPKQIQDPKSKTNPKSFWIFQVPDSLKTLGDIAKWWRRQFHLPCVAISGSNGKTTTKEMIASILSQKWSVLKTEGNFNNLIGLPLTLNRLSPSHQAVVLEMGMNAPGEIRRLTVIADPSVGLVTNAAAAHLEKLQTVEAVAKAKAELYETMSPEGVAIYNAEDIWMKKLVKKFKGKKISFGMQGACDVRFEHMENIGFDSMELKLSIQEKVLTAKLKTTGTHNVMNALAACATAWSLGFDLKAMQKGLENFKPLKMRLEQVQLANGVRLINDAYNANPVSMEAAFQTVSKQRRAGRFLAVLGDMKELGEASVALHEQIGKKAAECSVDQLYLLGEFAQAVASGAKTAGLNSKNIFLADHQEDLVKMLADRLQSGDVVLVKASRAMQLEKVAEELKARFGI